MKYRSPKSSLQNNIMFTCSDSAIDQVLSILQHLKMLGDMGCSRSVFIDGQFYEFDGDGSDKLDYIHINGLTMDEWEAEYKRITAIRNRHRILANDLSEDAA